jgi:hypothetical protein
MIYATGGLTIWALRFLSSYSFTAIACSRGWSTPEGSAIVVAGVALMSIAATVACTAIAARAWRGSRLGPPNGDDNQRFVHAIAGMVALLALLAIGWETVPIFVVPACA